jgi:DNA polymerase
LYITNVVKFRPPGNRKPTRAEIRSFLPFLLKEIEAVSPDIVCLLGNTAAEALLGKYPVTKYRGKIMRKRFMITYHPAAVLRNPNRKGDFQKDIMRLRKFYIRPEAITS